MDIISFFDKEDIFDVLSTMEDLNVNEKVTRKSKMYFVGLFISKITENGNNRQCI